MSKVCSTLTIFNEFHGKWHDHYFSIPKEALLFYWQSLSHVNYENLRRLRKKNGGTKTKVNATVGWQTHCKYSI